MTIDPDALATLPSPASAERELVRRRGLREFVRRAWPHVEPAVLRWNWHHDAMAEHLEAIHRREIHDLVINVPPGCSKSLFCSVIFPAWVWTLDPSHRWICASYSDKVVLRDARKCRSLVDSEWFRARWPEVQVPRDATASTAITDWYTTAGGMRYSATVRGQVTGQHADTQLVDDPIDPQGAAMASGVELDHVIEWWNVTMSTRARNISTLARVVVMQRLHERDLAAEMIRSGATVLCLPMEFEHAHPNRWARDPRTEEGELLDPVRFPPAATARLKGILGPSAVASQLQQRPSPAGGGVFLDVWFRYWTELPAEGIWSIEVDATFKKTEDGSFVVVQVWLDVGPAHYLVDQRRERMGFAATVAAILAMRLAWPKVRTVRVEGKANGPAVIETLRKDIPGVVEVEPDGGKEARANACQGIVAGGGVYLPHPERAMYPDGRRGARWVPEFVHEAITFPNAAHDDQVDAMTQHLNASAGSFASRMKAAVDRANPRR